MRFESLHIIGFGKFVNYNLPLGKDFHLFTGSNEAGKTTLVNAFLGVLYGFRGREKEVRQLKSRYRPWQKGVSFAAGLTVITAGGDKFYLERNFEEDRVKVYLWNEEQMLPSTFTPEKVLEPALGTMSMHLFTNTFLIKQEDINSLDRVGLGEAIGRKLVTGEDEVNLKESIKILDDKLREIYRGMERPASNPGPLKLLKDSIASTAQEIDELEQHFRDYAQVADEERRKRLRLGELRARLAKISPLVVAYEKINILDESIKVKTAQQQELLGCIEKVKERKKELDELYLKLSAHGPETRSLTEKTGRELESLRTSQAHLQDNLAVKNNRLAQLEQKRTGLELELKTLRTVLAGLYGAKYNRENLLEAESWQRRKEELGEQINVLERAGKIVEGTGSATEPERSRNSSRILLITGLAMALASAVGLMLPYVWGPVLGIVLLLAGLAGIWAGRHLNRLRRLENGMVSKGEWTDQGEVLYKKKNLEECSRFLNGLLGDDDLSGFRDKVLQRERLENDIQLKEKEIASVETAPYVEEINALEKETALLEGKVQAILGRAGVENSEDYFTRWEEIQRLYRGIAEKDKEIAFLLGEANLQEWQDRFTALTVEVVNLKEQRDSYAMYLTAGEYHELQQEIAELEAEERELSDEISALLATLENYTRLVFHGRDKWVLEASLGDMTRELTQLEIKAEGIKTALQLLHEAASEAQSQMAPRVKDKVTSIFQKVTSNRYNEVELAVEERGLACRVLASEKGNYIEPSSLSTGTRDLLYVALRVVLGEYLATAPGFPLLLDDPFVNFDEKRLSKMVAILQTLARDHQIIWFTKDSHIAGLVPGEAVAPLIS